MASKKKLDKLEIVQPTEGANYFTASGTNADGVSISITSVSLHGLRSAAIDNGFDPEQVDISGFSDGGLTEAADAEADANAATGGDAEAAAGAGNASSASTGGSPAGSTTGSASRAAAKASTT